MKKAAYILIAISCICSTAIALYDNDTDVKYLQLFTNNGKDVIKEYEHIDSITYSKYDKDGVKQDSYMTQEIWTKDSVYRNSLLSIDSLKVDQQPYYVYCSDIQEFIAENIKVGEDEGSVKGKIENYLANSSSVTDFSFDETYGYYSIEFDNGGRADITLFNMEDAYSANKPGKFKNNINKSVTSGSYYDVSHIEGEEIQDNNRLLYLWAGEFWTMENFYPRSEIDGIEEAIDNSPVDIKAEVIKDDVSILDRFNDYGAIVISQTHGRGEGAFYLCSKSWVNNLGDKFHFYRNYVISLLQRKVVDMVSPWFYYTVTPRYFSGKSFDYPFIYGNYCWSKGLGITGIYNSCFVGYDVASNFLINDDMSISYFTSLFNGQTHQKSVDNIGGYTFQNNWVEPATNHNKPDKRYFSISMNDVEDKGNGKFVVSGKINGFKNLKKDIDFRLYYETYGIDPDLESVKFINLHVDTEGNFREEFLVSDYINGTGGELKFQIAFKYNTNYYYGEIKSSGTKKGTKWIKMRTHCEDDEDDDFSLYGLGLSDANIISIEGAKKKYNSFYHDEYVVTSDDRQVFIEYDGTIGRLGEECESFITNDSIQEIYSWIGGSYYTDEEGWLEVFECGTAKRISRGAFHNTLLKSLELSGVERISEHAIEYNSELEYVKITGDSIILTEPEVNGDIISNNTKLKEVRVSGILWQEFFPEEMDKLSSRYISFSDFMSGVKAKDSRPKAYCDHCRGSIAIDSPKVYMPASDISEILNYYKSKYSQYSQEYYEHDMRIFEWLYMGNGHKTDCPNYQRIVFPL